MQTSFRQASVAAGDLQTAQAGIEMLQRGGNAVDAAVAAAFASFVAEFVLVNIGGGGIATLFDPQRGHAEVYDFFSNMPSGVVSPNLDFYPVQVDFGSTQQPFFIGRGSVAVPGVVAGLCQMAAEAGRLSLPVLLEPAVRLARDGALLTAAQAHMLNLIAPVLCATPKQAEWVRPNGQLLTAGARMVMPELAETLLALGQTGADLFYRGAVAQAILADQRQHGGLLQPADFANYRVDKLAPLAVPYRQFTVLLPPPCSLGGLLIAFGLHLLNDIPLAQYPHGGPAHLHVLAEVMRLTHVARAAWPTTTPDPAEFLADSHLAEYRQQLQQTLNGNGNPRPDAPLPRTPDHTSHISVIDAAGQMVGLTTSAGENAGFVVGDTGVSLNNMLGELDLHPSGFHKLVAGERLVTMMAPCVVLKGDQPVLVLGSGGSSRIRSAILQVLINVLDYGIPVAAAVQAPRIHFESGLLQAEGGISPASSQQMRQWGYTVNEWSTESMYFGGVHATGPHGAGADLRRGGVVLTT